MMPSPFPYRIIVAWSADDDAYVARVPAFDGAAAHGATPEDALREVLIAAEALVAAHRTHARELPASDLEPAS